MIIWVLQMLQSMRRFFESGKTRSLSFRKEQLLKVGLTFPSPSPLPPPEETRLARSEIC